MIHAPLPESDLLRFARLAAPLLQGAAAYGYGPQAARNRAGRGLEFLDTRRYEAGDDWRLIDWRQSARSKDLVIRRYQEETSTDWFICVDRSASVAWNFQKWVMTLQLSTALAYTLLHAGHRVALLLWSDRVHDICELGRGPHHFTALLRMLTHHRPAKAASNGRRQASNLGSCRAIISRNSNAFVLSDFLEPDGMLRDLKATCAHTAGVNAIQILADNEVHVPVRNSTALQDVESGDIQPVDLTDQIQSGAVVALRAHGDALRNACHGLNIRFTSCRSNQRWQQVLLDHLRLQN